MYFAYVVGSIKDFCISCKNTHYWIDRFVKKGHRAKRTKKNFTPRV